MCIFWFKILYGLGYKINKIIDEESLLVFLDIEIDDDFKDRDSERRKVMYCLRLQFGLCDSTTLFGGQHHDP